MDVIQRVDELAEIVLAAKPRAIGGGAIIDREQVMRIIEEIRASMPTEVVRAQDLLGSLEKVKNDAQAEADAIIARAEARAAHLVSEEEVMRTARAEAEELLSGAEAEAEKKRTSIDAYVESKLASFEGVLVKTLDAVSNGRQKLAAESENRTGAESHPEAGSRDQTVEPMP